jgi:hypothetical protein
VLVQERTGEPAEASIVRVQAQRARLRPTEREHLARGNPELLITHGDGKPSTLLRFHATTNVERSGPPYK